MMSAQAALRSDTRGATIVEFAIVAPVMILVLMGLGDVLHQAYVQAVLDGAIQKAGRDSAIEGGAENTTVIDNKVKTMVGTIIRNATWQSKRSYYSSFSAMKPEPFTDSNGNGRRDAKECYDDVNGNGLYDTDPARTGQGGAEDVTVYTMTVTYSRLFPIAKMVGAANTQTLSASTLLKNQPYRTQTQVAVQTRCN